MNIVRYVNTDWFKIWTEENTTLNNTAKHKSKYFVVSLWSGNL